MRRTLDIALVVSTTLALLAAPRTARAQRAAILPKHVTEGSVTAVHKGLAYLKHLQASDGSWIGTVDGAAYPISMTALAGMAFLAGGSTSSRGPHADQIRKALHFLMRFSTPNGLITSAQQESGRPMYGHGFALLFLTTLHGMESDPEVRKRLEPIIKNAIVLTERGQSRAGGWTYYPGGGDEGSVTITQIQALRSAHNAGFIVPESVIEGAIRYLERCRTEEGGIRYALSSDPSPRPAISAAAVATLYNAGDYDSEMAKACLEYVFAIFKNGGFEQTGHDFYAHLYASQAFYQAGETYWDVYFPQAQKYLVSRQEDSGAWEGDGVGPIYATSIALIILQLPYKLLPIYQR